MKLVPGTVGERISKIEIVIRADLALWWADLALQWADLAL